jgi:hypothetical protein
LVDHIQCDGGRKGQQGVCHNPKGGHGESSRKGECPSRSTRRQDNSVKKGRIEVGANEEKDRSHDLYFNYLPMD